MPAPARRRRIALLECDHVDAGLRGVAGDYADMFVRRFGQVAASLVLQRTDVVGGQPLPDLAAVDGLVVTGSRHSVTDPLGWIDDVGGLLREAAERELPVVGVCFGHQLIAHALGGTVERARTGWGIGVHGTEVVATRPWMVPRHDRVRLLMTHQDQVVALPPEAEVLARTDHAPIAALQVGSLVGVQGHPEFPARYLDALLASRTERIGAGPVAAARASLATPTDHLAVTGWLARHLGADEVGSELSAAAPASGRSTRRTPPATVSRLP